MRERAYGSAALGLYCQFRNRTEYNVRNPTTVVLARTIVTHSHRNGAVNAKFFLSIVFAFLIFTVVWVA